jgi:hypothetical protein
MKIYFFGKDMLNLPYACTNSKMLWRQWFKRLLSGTV